MEEKQNLQLNDWNAVLSFQGWGLNIPAFYLELELMEKQIGTPLHTFTFNI